MATIRINRDDAIAGGIFLAIGLFLGGNAVLFLPIGTAAEMGPGFFPLVLCSILVILGGTILLNANGKADDETAGSINYRAIALVTLSPVAFGLTIRSLGLVPALVIALALAVMAGERIGLLRSAAIVIGMTAVCVGIFYFGLRVPVQLINPGLMN
ncbi:MAG TPA: tripartite tricarboxylate transporter TctB family protein [Devosia sp.]|jgi:hypothetical protein|nr:tripartite tricarboxylate transporter TctB family protein [Devosia sp.]